MNDTKFTQSELDYLARASAKISEIVNKAGYDILEGLHLGIEAALRENMTTSDGETLEITDGYDVVLVSDSEYAYPFYLMHPWVKRSNG